MITAIDTNVLVDIFGSDPKYGHHSSQILRQCIKEGTICACEITWVETASLFPSREKFLAAMHTLGIEYSMIVQETALLTSEAWHKYRKNGGKRERVVADFLIGAHAFLQADRLLTRDRGFYRRYFHSLTVLDPTM